MVEQHSIRNTSYVIMQQDKKTTITLKDNGIPEKEVSFPINLHSIFFSSNRVFLYHMLQVVSEILVVLLEEAGLYFALCMSRV